MSATVVFWISFGVVVATQGCEIRATLRGAPRHLVIRQFYPIIAMGDLVCAAAGDSWLVRGIWGAFAVMNAWRWWNNRPPRPPRRRRSLATAGAR